MDIIKDGFNDIDRQPLPIPEGLAGLSDIRNISAMQVGFGSKSMRTDQDGMWFGGRTFADAPFSVNYNGQATFRNEDGETIVDADGIRSTSQFISTTLASASLQTTASTSYIDVSGSSFTITTTRAVQVLFSIYIQGYNDDYPNSDYGVNVRLYDSFLSGGAITLNDIHGIFSTSNISSDQNLNLLINFGTSSYSYNDGISTSWTQQREAETQAITIALLLGVGVHNYKLQMKAVGGGTGALSAFTIYSLTLGT